MVVLRAARELGDVKLDAKSSSPRSRILNLLNAGRRQRAVVGHRRRRDRLLPLRAARAAPVDRAAPDRAQSVPRRAGEARGERSVRLPGQVARGRRGQRAQGRRARLRVRPAVDGRRRRRRLHHAAQGAEDGAHPAAAARERRRAARARRARPADAERARAPRRRRRRQARRRDDLGRPLRGDRPGRRGGRLARARDGRSGRAARADGRGLPPRPRPELRPLRAGPDRLRRRLPLPRRDRGLARRAERAHRRARARRGRAAADGPLPAERRRERRGAVRRGRVGARVDRPRGRVGPRHGARQAVLGALGREGKGHALTY